VCVVPELRIPLLVEKHKRVEWVDRLALKETQRVTCANGSELGKMRIRGVGDTFQDASKLHPKSGGDIHRALELQFFLQNFYEGAELRACYFSWRGVNTL